EEIGGDPFLAVSGAEANPFLAPIRRGLIPGFRFRVERRAVIGIEAAVDPEDLSRSGGFLGESPRDSFDRARQGFWRRGRVSDAAQTVGGGPVEWGLRLRLREEIAGIAPRAPEDVAFSARLVPAPLLDVAGHVVTSVGREPLIRPDSGGAFSREVGKLQDLREDDVGARSVVPVVDRGKALPRKLGVGRRLVPGDAAHRVILLPLGVGPERPGGWAATSRRIAEFRHGLFDGKHATALDERLLPVLPFLVAAPVHELLDLAVGDLF